MASLLNMSGGSLLNKGLPYDAEIEYLESTGTQYIDTGIIPNIDLTVLISAICYNGPVIGSNVAGFTTRTYHIGVHYQGNINIEVGQNMIGIPIDQEKHDFKIDGTNKKLIIDELSKDTVVDVYSSSGVSLYLFAIHFSNRATVFYRGALYSCEIKNNETPIFDAIPVRVGNVGYMYDKVSGQLFGNQGTGNFILGPDK